MNEVTLSHNEEELRLYCQYLRLLADLEGAEEKVRRDEALKEGSPTFQGTFENVRRGIRRAFSDARGRKEEAEKALQAFHKDHPSLISPTQAKELTSLLFFADERGNARLLFALSIFAGDREHPEEKRGEEEVSSLLYGRKDVLPPLLHSFYENFKALSPKRHDEEREEILSACLALGVLGLLTCPVAIGATATLGGLFAGVAISGALTAEAVLFATSLVALAYGAAELEALKGKEKDLSTEQNALLLATELTLVEMYRKTLGEEDFKTELDGILQGVATLKGDLDFYAFVENGLDETAKDKLASFHAFDDRLASILCR